MATQNGIWLYRSKERQGSYRLLLIPSADGKFHAQRHRFNADGTSLPLQMGDVFSGDTQKEAVAWLNQQHLTLTLRGWSQIVAAGIAKSIQLSSDTAARQGAQRIRKLRKDRHQRQAYVGSQRAAALA